MVRMQIILKISFFISFPWKEVYSIKKAEIFSLRDESVVSDLVSGDAGSLSPERAHHMLLATSCSSHVDISPARRA